MPHRLLKLVPRCLSRTPVPHTPTHTFIAEDVVWAMGSNGIQFDMTEVSKDFAATLAQSGKGDLSQVKGYQYFQTYLNRPTTTMLSPQERALIQSLLPYMRDWYVQAGASGMNATDTLNRGAFMLGGNGADALVGGTKADLLVGNAGADTLEGGQGNDFLLGGTGNDTYVYTSGDGFGTLVDADGNGSIAMDGATLAGGAEYGDSHVHRDDNGHLYVDVGSGRLVIDGNILIEGYQPGRGNGMNLAMMDAVAQAYPQTTLSITGDISPDDIDQSTEGIQAAGDAQQNPLGTPQPYEDILGGSDGNDILSGDLNDDVGGEAGDDWIEGGSGSDYLGGGANNDLIEGGSGNDLLAGEDGNDWLYGNVQIDTATAISQGNSDTTTGLKGEWLRWRIRSGNFSINKAANDETTNARRVAA